MGGWGGWGGRGGWGQKLKMSPDDDGDEVKPDQPRLVKNYEKCSIQSTKKAERDSFAFGEKCVM